MKNNTNCQHDASKPSSTIHLKGDGTFSCFYCGFTTDYFSASFGPLNGLPINPPSLEDTLKSQGEESYNRAMKGVI